MGSDSLYCGKWRKISKSHDDLDLGPMMPNIELVLRYFYHRNIMLNISFLACTKVELWVLIVCIVVNGEKFQSPMMTLTLVR